MFTTVNISDIKPAEYNPRHLDEAAFEALKMSIERLGLIKPIIVREENMTIVAGHQRTKVLTALGIHEVPAYIIEGIGFQDEVRFNQYHNMCEIPFREKQPKLRIKKDIKIPVGGFIEVDPDDIDLQSPGETGILVSALSKMVMKYDAFANAVVNHKNEVILSNMYAMACKLLEIPLLVSAVSQDNEDFAINAFGREYGVFSYDNVPKETYAQSFAQPSRLRRNGAGKIGSSTRSRAQENVVMPFMEKNDPNKVLSSLDFGAGHKDYVRKYRSEGYNAFGMEFYLRRQGSFTINVMQVNFDFQALKNQVSKHGLFDVVICDSVLNSVDSKEAERAVLMCLNAFCKPGGTIVWSGKDIRVCKRKMQGMTDRSGGTGQQQIYFFDDDGFTATMRNGRWYFQLWHTKADALLKSKMWLTSKPNWKPSSQNFTISGINDVRLVSKDLREALRFEFSLPLPNGERYTLFDDNREFFEHIIKLNHGEY